MRGISLGGKNGEADQGKFPVDAVKKKSQGRIKGSEKNRGGKKRPDDKQGITINIKLSRGEGQPKRL